MRQVFFSRMRPAGNRRGVSGRAYALRSVLGASPGCHEQRGDVSDTLRCPAPGAELSTGCHHSTSGPSRLADSLASDAAHPSDTSRLDCRRMFLRRLSTLLRRAVTLALHARNAKKIRSLTRLINSSIVRNFACNACKNDSIFSKNASVSYAVDSSTDRMMLSRKASAFWRRIDVQPRSTARRPRRSRHHSLRSRRCIGIETAKWPVCRFFAGTKTRATVPRGTHRRS